jgi:hypothetical protein
MKNMPLTKTFNVVVCPQSLPLLIFLFQISDSPAKISGNADPPLTTPDATLNDDDEEEEEDSHCLF